VEPASVHGRILVDHRSDQHRLGATQRQKDPLGRLVAGGRHPGCARRLDCLVASHPDPALRNLGDTWGSYLLGSVQVLLGVVALTSPWEPIPVAWLIASGWCLITGLLMVLDARRLRARAYSDGAVDQE
jgi:hypothetical protein